MPRLYKYSNDWEIGTPLFPQKFPNFKISQVYNSEYILNYKGQEASWRYIYLFTV